MLTNSHLPLFIADVGQGLPDSKAKADLLQILFHTCLELVRTAFLPGSGCDVLPA